MTVRKEEFDLCKVLNIDKSEEPMFMSSFTQYVQGSKKSKNELLSIIYKNNKNEKKLIQIENPDVGGYWIKDEYFSNRKNGSCPYYLDRDMVEPIVFNHKYASTDLARFVAQETGDNRVEQFRLACMDKGMKIDKSYFGLSNKVHFYKRFMNTDGDVKDFYKKMFKRTFGERDLKLTKCLVDIESDIAIGTIDTNNGQGTSPINAITLIDSEKHTVITLLLKNENYNGINEIMSDIEGTQEKISSYFNKLYGAKSDYKHKNLYKDYVFKIKFFDKEIDLIKTTFGIINSQKYDYVTGWNFLSFDMRYMKYRIESLGYDPREIMCHKDFMNPYINIRISENTNKPVERKDSMTCSSYSIFIDQMLLFLHVRKAKTFPSAKLDYILATEMNARKIDYTQNKFTIRDLPYKDFFLFILYNINDVILLDLLESKNMDIEHLYQKGILTSTDYKKLFNETLFLRNLMDDYLYRHGMVMGNNLNTKFDIITLSDGDEKTLTNEQLEEKFEGAIVGQPDFICHIGETIYGFKSNRIFKYVKDMDVTSEYPTAIKQYNISGEKEIGRLVMRKENMTCRERINSPNIIADSYEKYDRGGAFIDDMELREPTLLGYRWFNLPSIKDIMDGYETRRKNKPINLFKVGA